MSETSISRTFERVSDPRIERTKRHKLIDIITIGLGGTICGGDNWVEIVAWGVAKESWLRTFLELPNGIPSHDTFSDVFGRINPDEFRRCFIEWVQAVHVLTEGQVVAIDGKTLCGSVDKLRGKRAIHMVSAWASQNRLVLGQLKVDAKSNEITAIPEMLTLLDIAGCTVTIDAMGCQTEIAQAIIDAQADYVLAVKKTRDASTKISRVCLRAVRKWPIKMCPTIMPAPWKKTRDALKSASAGPLPMRNSWLIGALSMPGRI
jgi:hypothetical protein